LFLKLSGVKIAKLQIDTRFQVFAEVAQIEEQAESRAEQSAQQSAGKE